jgi:hypothetical protein
MRTDSAADWEFFINEAEIWNNWSPPPPIEFVDTIDVIEGPNWLKTQYGAFVDACHFSVLFSYFNGPHVSEAVA